MPSLPRPSGEKAWGEGQRLPVHPSVPANLEPGFSCPACGDSDWHEGFLLREYFAAPPVHRSGAGGFELETASTGPLILRERQPDRPGRAAGSRPGHSHVLRTGCVRHLPDRLESRHTRSSRPVPHARGTRRLRPVFAVLLTGQQCATGTGFLRRALHHLASPLHPRRGDRAPRRKIPGVRVAYNVLFLRY